MNNSQTMNKNKKEKRLKIVIELIGGTGNQLFQLAACFMLAKIHNRDPYYTNRLLDGNRKNETTGISKELNIKCINSKQIIDWPLLSEEELVHPAYFSFYPETNYLPAKDIVLTGYFQNFKIHDHNLRRILKKYAKESFNKVHRLNENFISIHTRELQASRNDLPLVGKDTLSLKYYQRSLEIIEKKLEKSENKISTIYLFNDMFNKDKNKSKILNLLLDFIKKKNYKVILGDELCSTAWETISIMSQGKYIITSTSTFSWWAGYLSEGTVICPIFSLWDVLLITPENWIQINDGNLSPKTWHNLNIYKSKKVKLYKRKFNNRFIRKIKHIFYYYIFERTFLNIFTKYSNLKIRNIKN